VKFLVVVPMLVHVYIFLLETLLWGKPKTNALLGLRRMEAEISRGLAFHQGVYNLLLAGAVFVGWSLWMGFPTLDQGPFAGLVLLAYGLGSMVVGGLSFLASSPRLWPAALVQLLPAVLGLAIVFLPLS